MELIITEFYVGNECKFAGIMRDTSKKVNAEPILRESELRFRLAFDYSPIGIALVSLEGRWLKVNKTLCEIVAYSESELLQTDFQSITYPDHLEEELLAYQAHYDALTGLINRN